MNIPHRSSSYFLYSCFHALCNAHILRELIFVFEQFHQKWAKEMIDCLLDIKMADDAAKLSEEKMLSSEKLIAFETRFKAIIKQGFSENKLPKQKPGTKKKRGRVAKPKPYNLVDRLDKHIFQHILWKIRLCPDLCGLREFSNFPSFMKTQNVSLPDFFKDIILLIATT